MSSVIVLTGRRGSGKSYFASQLAQNERLAVVNVGDLIVRRLSSAGIVPSSRSMAGEIFLKTFGEAHLNELVANVARDHEFLVLDGVRFSSVCRGLKARGHQITVVSVSCTETERRMRLLRRDGCIEAGTRYDFQIQRLARSADVYIVNEPGKIIARLSHRSSSNNPLRWLLDRIGKILGAKFGEIGHRSILGLTNTQVAHNWRSKNPASKLKRSRGKSLSGECEILGRVRHQPSFHSS